jgi:hypothetical protein
MSAAPAIRYPVATWNLAIGPAEVDAVVGVAGRQIERGLHRARHLRGAKQCPKALDRAHVDGGAERPLGSTWPIVSGPAGLRPRKHRTASRRAWFQLGLLAEEAAAAAVAVESAAIVVAADRPSAALAVAAAKIRRRRGRWQGRRDRPIRCRARWLHAPAQSAPPAPPAPGVARRVRQANPVVARARQEGDGDRCRRPLADDHCRVTRFASPWAIPMVSGQRCWLVNAAHLRRPIQRAGHKPVPRGDAKNRAFAHPRTSIQRARTGRTSLRQ